MWTGAPRIAFVEWKDEVTEKVIVITGASDGIGASAARALTAAGHRVVIVGRSAAKTESIANELNVPHYLADFAKLDDVRTLAQRLLTDLPRIDVLANNAGGIMGPRTLTRDGNEMTVQVNHLAPFLLTNLLLDALTSSNASVICTASSAHRSARHLDLDDLTLTRRYSATRAYGTAKLMNILFARELQRRYGSRGLRAASFHPGVVRTSFASEFGGLMHVGVTSPARLLFRTPARGADTLVWLATSDGWEPGQYFKDRRVARRSKQADDDELARGLWERSMSLVMPEEAG
jgi:NAD(P)-dependent dehydrogenase (short-subunit alcohol dehydrogenase family)